MAGTGMSSRAAAAAKALAAWTRASTHAVKDVIVNALVAGRTMTGRGGKTVIGLPHHRVREILRRHGMLVEGPGH